MSEENLDEEIIEESEEITLEISTHSGDVDVLVVSEYNPAEMEEKRNNNENEAIRIGDNVYSRIDLKNIKVIQGDAE